MSDLSWQSLSACVDAPRELFFPTRTEGGVNRGNEAKSWCSRCPVIDECLRYAIAGREKHGVWGGAGEPTRRRLSKLTDAPGFVDSHRHGCTCRFCVAAAAHVEAVRRAFTDQGKIIHGRWEAYVHAGCRCRDCSRARRAAGRPET